MLEISEVQAKEMDFLSLNEETVMHGSKTWWRGNNQRETVSNTPYFGRKEENTSTRIFMN